MTKEMTPEQEVHSWLEEYAGERVSAAHFLCDRHARVPEQLALFYEDAQGETSKWTFRELLELSSQMAGFLRSAGVGKGDRVAALLPKTPELLISALAVWRLGAGYVPLFTAFGPDAIDYRLQDSGTRLLITNAAQRPKLEEISAAVKADLNIVTVPGARGIGIAKGDYSFWHELERASALMDPVPVSGDSLMIMLYTSGTTGSPKGVQVPVKALASFEAYMRFAIDLRAEDMYWNMADPGWAYGLYYNLIGPLLLGKSALFFNAPFSPPEIYRVLHKYRVTNFASAPTAYRALRAAGDKIAGQYSYHLRVASSAGEPLNPELMEWSEKLWGIRIHDHFGQTELGMTANNHHLPGLQRQLKPGSMGHSMPGLRMVVVDEEGRELPPGSEGQLAVDTEKSPLFWFQGYWNDAARTGEKFVGKGRYYLAGDAASQDQEGYLFFSGRSDDIILSAGYRIGPFEVESALMKHPSVAEAAVVGMPDELRGEAVEAFVVLTSGVAKTEQLEEELQVFVKKHLSAHAYPRRIAFVDQLPKTPSGKIQRFLLRG